MKIVDDRSHTRPVFGDLKVGDCFDFHDEIFMACKEIETKEGDIINAISLKYGNLATFFANENITPIETATLVLE